jgi:gas vesicle protein
MAEENRGGDNTLTVFLLGGLLGAIAGLLLAPRTGKDTRRRLAGWLEDLEEKSGDLLDEGRDLLQEGKEALHGKTEKLKRVIESGRKLWGDEQSKQ